MAKFVNFAVLDGALNLVASATRIVAVSGQPATYVAADAGKLAEATLAAGDFALAAGDVSGRKVGIAAKPGLTVIAAGTADHIALLDPATSSLLYVTTCPAQVLPAGGTVSIGAWSVEIEAPV